MGQRIVVVLCDTSSLYLSFYGFANCFCRKYQDMTQTRRPINLAVQVHYRRRWFKIQMFPFTPGTVEVCIWSHPCVFGD